jgi:membrane protease YdiL (CAAX protease family)
MLRLMDKRPFAALGFALHGRVWIELGQGALQGFLMVSVVFLVEWGFGWVTVVRQALDIRQLLNDAAYYTILLSLAALFEETATRGYAFQALIQGAGKPAAIIITSLLFGLVHAANPHTSIFGVLNTALAGIWLAIAYLKTRSLWLPTSLHTVWNLTLGFVFGFPLSGVILPQTLMRSSGSGPVWLTGGDYGPEAGAVTSAVLLAGTFFTWISPRVRPSPRAAALWWPEAPAIVDPGGPS